MVYLCDGILWIYVKFILCEERMVFLINDIGLIRYIYEKKF